MQDGAWFKSSLVYILKFRKLSNLGLVKFLVMFQNMFQTLHCVKKTVLSLNCKSEISNVCNVVEGHCLQAMKIVRHRTNGRFDWLISGHQIVNPSREAISMLSSKYKGLRLSILWLTDSLGQLSLKRCHSIFENILNYH